MKATTYLYVFYGYINISGKEVKTFVIPGKVVRAVEELRCRDGTGRTYIQGCMVLKEPMTPTQLRRAVDSPCLMLVASDNSTASREERMHLYTEVTKSQRNAVHALFNTSVDITQRNTALDALHLGRVPRN